MEFVRNMFDFDCPGNKIKRFAKTAYVVSVISAVVAAVLAVFFAAISLLGSGMDIGYLFGTLIILFTLGAVFVVLTFLIALFTLWLPFIVLYNYGENTERLAAIDMNTRKMNINADKMSANHKANTIRDSFKNTTDAYNKGAAAPAQPATSSQPKSYSQSESPVAPAEVKPKVESAPVATPAPEKKAIATVADKINYALQFQSDEGMIRYLTKIDDENVQNILQAPPAMVRGLLREYINKLEENN